MSWDWRRTLERGKMRGKSEKTHFATAPCLFNSLSIKYIAKRAKGGVTVFLHKKKENSVALD